MTYEELLTLITEVECVLNSRPISYLETDEPLTPAHLLIGTRTNNLPDHLVYVDEDYYQTQDEKMLDRRARYLEKLIIGFLKRW